MKTCGHWHRIKKCHAGGEFYVFKEATGDGGSYVCGKHLAAMVRRISDKYAGDHYKGDPGSVKVDWAGAHSDEAKNKDTTGARIGL